MPVHLLALQSDEDQACLSDDYEACLAAENQVQVRRNEVFQVQAYQNTRIHDC